MKINQNNNAVRNYELNPKILSSYRRDRLQRINNIYQPLNPNAIDFFKTDLVNGMPERVYILATGPNGKEYHDKIPDNAYVIAVNQGIMIRPNCNLWMVFDHRCLSKPWWAEAVTINGPKRLFSRQPIRMVLCDYTFITTPSLVGKPPDELRRGVLRGGATIAGSAVQAAYYGGAKVITMIGVDMSGLQYYDGSYNNSVTVRGRDQEWVNLQAFNNMVAHIQKNGVIVNSLSKTAISVEQVRE